MIAAKSIINGDYYVQEVNQNIIIYYFQENGNPYSMKFKETGHFERKFGEGFFSEAGKSYNDLARIERGLLL